MKHFISFAFISMILVVQVLAQGFSEIASPGGLGGIKPKRVAWVDFNGDGWPDLLIDRTRVFLSHPQKNKSSSPRVFKEVVGALPDKVATWKNTIALPGDIDGDGNQDIFLGVNCDFAKPKVDKKTGKVVLDDKGKPVPAVPDDGRRNHVFLGDGKGGFKAVAKCGLEEPCGTVCAASFLDYDADGVLDIFIGHWYRAYGQSLECYSDRLYRGLGGGKFADVTEKAGLLTKRNAGGRLSSKPTYGAATVDWNNDGWTDILVCTYGRQWNWLWRNNGDGTFTDVGAATKWDGDDIRHGRHPEVIRTKYGRKDEKPFRSNGNTFDVAVGDIDNDGDMDLFSAEITHFWAGSSSDFSMFLINLGGKKKWAFQRDLSLVPARHKFPWKPGLPQWNQGDLHSALFDYDNDGWLDLVIASSDYPDDQFLRFYRNQQGKGFVEVTQKLGVKWRSPAGISLADFDRDGRLDLICGKSHMRLKKEQRKAGPLAAGLWHNQCGKGNNWLMIDLIGAGKGKANRMAVGARVMAVAGDQRWYREVQGGAGHAGHLNDRLVHFGFGKLKRLERLEITWPGGEKTVRRDVQVDQYITVKQK